MLDALAFKKIKDTTGGELRVYMNGGGPIAKDTAHFISMTITSMLGGYGLIETTCVGALMDPMHWIDGAVGDIPSSIEIKLVDSPDTVYFIEKAPPQGEIWTRGDSIMDGYFENEKETSEAMTNDGWFKTGDTGEFDKNGQLRIIDRKKNLVKTLNGEYVAIICVYADLEKNKPIAIIVPAEPALQKVAHENGIEDLSHNKKLTAIVLKDIQATGKTLGLLGIETMEGLVMADDE